MFHRLEYISFTLRFFMSKILMLLLVLGQASAWASDPAKVEQEITLEDLFTDEDLAALALQEDDEAADLFKDDEISQVEDSDNLFP
jgi:hypothetical protein